MMYTLLKVITEQNNKKLKWWKTCLISCFIGFLAGCAVLLNFKIVHLLDGYIVGNLIFVTVIVEVFALITFYGKFNQNYLHNCIWNIWNSNNLSTLWSSLAVPKETEYSIRTELNRVIAGPRFISQGKVHSLLKSKLSAQEIDTFNYCSYGFSE